MGLMPDDEERPRRMLARGSMCRRIVDRLDVPEGDRPDLERLIAGCPVGAGVRVQVVVAAVAGGVFGAVVGIAFGLLVLLIASMVAPGLADLLAVVPVLATGIGILGGATYVGWHQLDDARAAMVERRLKARACLWCAAGVHGVPLDSDVSHVLLRCPECGETTLRLSGPPGRPLRRAGDRPI